MPHRVAPCWFMETWVSRTADGTLRGFGRWYAGLHIPRCPRCREALEELQALLLRLGSLRCEGPVLPGLPKDRWAAIERAWSDADARRPPGG